MKPINLNIIELKRRLLCHEVRCWSKFTEQGGNNHGQIVEAFQKAVDGRAGGEAWCLAFCMFCIQKVDAATDEIFQAAMPYRNILEKTEHCLTCWHKSPVIAKFDEPDFGRIVIWQHGESTRGHAGVVLKVEGDRKNMWVMEGNTKDPDGKVLVDGVFLKKRSTKKNGNMRVVGYLQPWVAEG